MNLMARSTLRQWALKVALILIGALSGLIVLEIGARLLLPPADILFENYGDTYMCAPGVGWRGRPNYRGMLTREEYTHLVEFNTIGMYDSDHPFEKTKNVFRILWLGDSFAQALQVGETDTAHQQLENLLNQRLASPQRPFEVVSAGVIGWGNGQALSYYRDQGHLFQADLVLLLFFVGNDLDDNLPGHALTIDGFNCFAPYFPVCADGKLDPEPWYYIPGLEPAWHDCSPARKWLAARLALIQHNSYLFARLEPLLLWLKPRRSYGQRFGLPFAALYLPDESEEVDYSWQVAQGLLVQFNQEVKADGADFAVIIVGPREVLWLALLTAEQLQSFYQSDPMFKDARMDYPNQRLANFLEQQAIPTLDLQQPMLDYIRQTGVQLYLPIDRHWTVEGNRLAAEFIFAWLLEQNLLADQN
jgi:hypothetical protein